MVPWDSRGPAAKGSLVQGYPHVPGEETTDQFSKSPHKYMMERELEYLRCHLEVEGGLEFPHLSATCVRRRRNRLSGAFMEQFTPGAPVTA